ncbi:cobalamin biosynthesis protein [Desulfonatronovibrio hydrogenovorans]|uniref:cobalamin biosynthesis protein n=1 Tax=Desulfonatronovibrio hydrogenovorans TaxID=53245 RepID=UPI0006925B01|nr:cobalamin biosynthesis protein [Desulfonatronovibrio hydrogenovorans]
MAGHDNKPALVTLSVRGLNLARKLSRVLGGDIYVHSEAPPGKGVMVFDRIMDLAGKLFAGYKRIIFILPVGVAVRAIAGHTGHKTIDPAVVVVDVGGRWAISLLSGHEGGANKLALEAANILGCEPVITTSTEAEKDIVVGVGCRKGVQAGDVMHALHHCLDKTGVNVSRVRLLVSVDIKKNEPGLVLAAEKLDIPLYFLASAMIRNIPLNTAESKFVMDKVGLPGVAEPCALLSARNPELILGKTVCNSVTIAIARENCL